VSEWVIVIYCQVCNFTLISCEKFIFDKIDDDDDICFELIQHVEFDFYSASSLKQQSIERHVSPLEHIILIQSEPIIGLTT
jgi:hypothetical protein